MARTVGVMCSLSFTEVLCAQGINDIRGQEVTGVCVWALGSPSCHIPWIGSCHLWQIINACGLLFYSAGKNEALTLFLLPPTPTQVRMGEVGKVRGAYEENRKEESPC